MSISSEQALEAKIFLTLYKEAIVALKQSALRDSDNEVIEDFTNRIIRIHDNKIFRRICNTNDNFLSSQNISKHLELVRNVRAFQFSQYAFLKYLPKFMKFEGNGTDMVVYLKGQNAELKKDLDS